MRQIPFIKFILFALSLSNLVLFDVWKRLFVTDHSRFKLFLPRTPAPYWSALLCLGLFTLFIFGALVLLHKTPRLRLLFLLYVFSIPANSLRFLVGFQNDGKGSFFFFLTVGVITTFILYLYCRKATWLEAKLFLILTIAFPCVVSNVGITFWQLATREFQNIKYDNTSTKDPSNHRVVFLLFDGVDFRHAFVDSQKLKHFESLRKESVFATAAVSPTDRTVGSVGSYLLGTPQHSFEYLNKPINSSLFSEIRGMGKRSAIAGWYLPYCRLFGEDLRECFSLCTSGYCRLQYSKKIWQNLSNYMLNTLQYGRTKPWVSFNATNERLVEEVKNLVTSPEIDFVFVHLPVPHEPWISKSIPKNEVEGYEGNLQIADQSLGQIIDVLKSSYQWNKTTLIVTSDHWWREAPLHFKRKDERIPFIVKLASNGQIDGGVEFTRPFNSIISYELIKALLRKEFSNQTALVTWLSKNVKQTSPFYFFKNFDGATVIH